VTGNRDFHAQPHWQAARLFKAQHGAAAPPPPRAAPGPGPSLSLPWVLPSPTRSPGQPASELATLSNRGAPATSAALTVTSRRGSFKCQCGPRVTVPVTRPEKRRYYPGQARTGSARCRRAGVTYFTRSGFRVKFKFPCPGNLLVRSDPGPDQPEWPAGSESRGGRAGRQAAGRLVEGGAGAPLHRYTPGPKPLA
jgi:hypothetical protein